MDVRHFVSPDGTMYRITSADQLSVTELDAVLERVKEMDQTELAMEGQVTLKILSSSHQLYQ